MLNGAICFKAVYIVCGYTDLLAMLVESQTGNKLYIIVPCIISVGNI